MQTFYKIFAIIYGCIGYFTLIELMFTLFGKRDYKTYEIIMLVIILAYSTITCSNRLSKIN